ncbi:MAG: hypothetical protein D6719_02835 [Candidatus Dadabacteria bacterium]|nr:MAG: hypothetical protein D6719_02835 [Candidatus Dadabacteria bacterium]
MNDKISREKKEAINRFLNDEYVLVHLDPSVPGTAIPPHLMHNSSVTLKLSRFFRGAMEVKDNEIHADLLFDNEYFNCIIPFSAIWGLTAFDGSNMIWPEATPKDVLKNLLKEATRENKPARKKASSKTKHKEIKKGHLRRVK